MPLWRTLMSALTAAWQPEPKYIVESEPIPELDLLFEETREKALAQDEMLTALKEDVNRLIYDVTDRLQGKHIKVYWTRSGKEYSRKGLFASIGFWSSSGEPYIGLRSESNKSQIDDYTIDYESKVYLLTSLVPEKTEEVPEFNQFQAKAIEYTNKKERAQEEKAVQRRRLREAIEGHIGEYVVLEKVKHRNRKGSYKLEDAVGKLLGQAVIRHNAGYFGTDRYYTNNERLVLELIEEDIIIPYYITPETRIRRVTRLEEREKAQVS